MRAIYLTQLSSLVPGPKIELNSKEVVHHLKNVIRVKSGEKLKLLDGVGLEVTCCVTQVSKKSISIDVVDICSHESAAVIDLAFGAVKKAASEEIIRLSVELGFRKVTSVLTEYSQKDFLSSERCDRILSSALEQSNNPFMPIIENGVKLEEINYGKYARVYFFHPGGKQESCSESKAGEGSLLLIGPEGGFGPEEIDFLKSLENTQQISLPTPILRAPTAVPAAFGYVLRDL
ncbi:MAG: 16S rRNA (uracil(1498)-N(3))-methyltransferase [Bacteriovoracaceae bacterium]|nr:16S rRNA (uracil(1498)-N(3))-methyltransferase [Bacteriovoracaceae bacterium]